MTSRRIPPSEKTLLDQDDSRGLNRAPSDKSNIAPAVPAAIIIKLLLFTLAMVSAPIGTYFLTLHTIFQGNSTWAGATAAIMANLVLVAYVIVAMKEDQGERLEGKGGKGE